jgi:hypothetical protein
MRREIAAVLDRERPVVANVHDDRWGTDFSEHVADIDVECHPRQLHCLRATDVLLDSRVVVLDLGVTGPARAEELRGHPRAEMLAVTVDHLLADTGGYSVGVLVSLYLSSETIDDEQTLRSFRVPDRKRNANCSTNVVREEHGSIALGVIEHRCDVIGLFPNRRWVVRGQRIGPTAPPGVMDDQST